MQNEVYMELKSRNIMKEIVKSHMMWSRKRWYQNGDLFVQVKMVPLTSRVGVKLLQVAIALGVSVEVIVFKLRSEWQEAFSHSDL